MWTVHPESMDLLNDCWPANVFGSPMYSLCKRLKLLKGPLKLLNKLHFSHISERVVRTEKELVQHQLRLHVDRDNEELLLQDKLLRLRLVNLKSFEKMFFGQKLKASCLKFSDKGTKFFHAMMSHKHRHNIIHAIRRSDGLMTTSWEEVGAEFVSFFQHSLGCSKDTIPVEVLVV